MLLATTGILFVVLVAFSVPIVFALGAAAVMGLVLGGNSLEMLASSLVGASQNWVLKELQQRARHLYWLNPEPRGYWDTGDSIISEFGIYCDGVYECRNLRQLERFVTTIVEG